MKQFLLILFFITAVSAKAQYWFGPKAGLQFTQHQYMSEQYTDTFDVNVNLSWHVGAVMTYTASKLFSVHGELNYENVGRTVKYNPELTTIAGSKSSYHYLTTPILMRVNFGRGPVQFYVNGGIKLNFWLAGGGKIYLDEFDEYSLDTLDYKIVFKQFKSNGRENRALVKANRVQYGFAIGGGANFDLFNGSRIMVDMRLNFNQSNIGFNGSPDFTWVGYYENFEFRNASLSASVAYLFEFNAQLQRKGKSTNPNSKR